MPSWDPSLYLEILHIFAQSLFFWNLLLCPNVQFIPALLSRWHNFQPPSSAVHPHLLSSLTHPSILHSLRQTIKQAFPWLTCDSPWPPQHPKPQTVRVRVGCSLGSRVAQNACVSWSRIWVPQGLSTVRSVLLSSWGHTDSRHAHTAVGGEKNVKMKEK